MTSEPTRVPSEVTTGLEALEVAPVFRRLVEDLATEESLTADPPISGYVGVRPAYNGTISLYVHRSSISVALEPDRARVAADRTGGSLQKKNPTTWFLRLKPEMMSETPGYDLVLELGRSALAKSLAGPAYEGGTEAARSFAAARSICEGCRQYEVAANGTCMCGWGED